MSIRLTVDKALRPTASKVNGRLQSSADGELCFVTVEVVDAQGRVVPTADTRLTFAVSGAGTLLAVGNADIKDEDPFFDSAHCVWHGRALAVVRRDGKKDKAVLSVSAKGLPTSRLTLK